MPDERTSTIGQILQLAGCCGNRFSRKAVRELHQAVRGKSVVHRRDCKSALPWQGCVQLQERDCLSPAKGEEVDR